jgi:tetratricopeptide (TPR) repeat protein
VSRTARFLTGALVALLLTGTAVATRALDSSQAMPLTNISPTGSFLAGRQALVDMRTSDAARFFGDAARASWDNPELVQQSFMAYLADGQIDQAASVGKHFIEIGGPNDLASVVIATKALKERRYADAVTAVAGAGDDTFAGIASSILAAWALAGQGDSAGADKMLDVLGQGDLEDFTLLHRALLDEVQGRSDDAIKWAKQAYDGGARSVRLIEAYVRFLGNKGRFDEAEKILADFGAQGAAHPLIDAVKASIDKKERPGPMASSVQAGAAELMFSIGAGLARENTEDIAAGFLRLGMYLDPGSDIIDVTLGELLDSVGRHDEANELYKAIPAKSVMKSSAILHEAVNLAALGDRPEAIRQLRNIVTAEPDNVDALAALGDLLSNDKQYEDATTTYTRVIDLLGASTPGNWVYYYDRGVAFERSKQWPKAEADFKKALALNPKQPAVLNYLGYSWVDQGINLKQALEMIQQAVNGAPNDGLIVDSLGWAYFRLGQYDKAVGTLEQAVQMRPVDAEINDHLGDAYYRAGRKLEATFQWNIAASLDKDGKVKERVAKKLAGDLSVIGSTGSGDVVETSADAAGTEKPAN